jgi:hypothetical protein
MGIFDPIRPITALKEKETLKGGDLTVLVTALGSWGKPVPHGHYSNTINTMTLIITLSLF